MTTTNRWRTAFAVIAVLFVVAFMRQSSEDSEGNTTSTTDSATFSFPSNIAALSCTELAAAHTQLGARLAAHISEIRRASWDDKMAERSIQADPGVAEGQASLRAIGEYQSTCK